MNSRDRKPKAWNRYRPREVLLPAGIGLIDRVVGGTDDAYRRRAEYFADLRIAPSPTSDGDFRVEITIEARRTGTKQVLLRQVRERQPPPVASTRHHPPFHLCQPRLEETKR